MPLSSKKVCGTAPVKKKWSAAWSSPPIARACGVSAELDLGLAASERLATDTTRHAEPVQRLLDGDARWVTVHPDGRMAVDGDAPGALLPGSFNPMHAGHTELAQVAGDVLGRSGRV